MLARIYLRAHANACTQTYFCTVDNLLQVLVEYIDVIINKPESKQFEKHGIGLRLAAGCCALYIIHKYGLEISGARCQSIFQMLLLNFNRDKSKCEDYEELVTVHFVEQQWKK